MGTADIVPGVSGGTVALVLGIYERLVTAISHFDLALLGHLRQKRLRQASRHIDLRFLVTLGVGIIGGFIVMTVLMNHLLTNPVTRSITLSVFLGLIFASAIHVAMLIRVASWTAGLACVLLALIGGGFAYWLTTLGNRACEPTNLYIFVCGSVAICAMILPGISGAMVLLIMGVYIHLTEIPRNIVHGEHVADGLLTVLVFGTGAAISLVLFSKFLRWLLARFHAATMALLCGFMIGALPKIWPFQRDLTPETEKFKYKSFELYFPDSIDTGVAMAAVAFVAAAAAVFLVDWYAKRTARQDD
jgi:putative membrane protein